MSDAEWFPPASDPTPPPPGAPTPSDGSSPSSPASSPASPHQRVDRRTVIWIVAGIAALVALVRIGDLTTYKILLFAAFVPSVMVHEVSHGVAALAFGDDTAKRARRITLNPLRHIDPFGTLILPVMMALSGGGVLGYAKPVPVDVGRLRSPRNHSVVVSLVGPGVNIVLALVCAVALRHGVAAHTRVVAGLGSSDGVVLGVLPGWAQYVFLLGFVNVILAAFNLIPLPPLDGSAVLERLLPTRWLPRYFRIRPLTMFVPLIVVFLFPSALGHLFGPLQQWWGSLVS
jgi:Zn-dependent protease